MTHDHTLVAETLSLGYGDRVVVDSLDLAIPPGKITVVVGANACGKSTVLKAMSRLLPTRSGAVLLDGRSIHTMPTKEVARTLGLLPQSPIAPEGITVSDLVGRGRHPHHSVLSRWSAEDDVAVARALEVTGTADLADRSIDELSGGQRQRVWIAMVLAQQSDLLLLDEPTTFLDVTHQVEVLDLLTDLNREYGTTIVMVLHELNLAARYADHLVAVKGGALYAAGDPTEVLTEQCVKEVFGLSSMVVPDPTCGKPLVLPLGRHHVADGVRPVSSDEEAGIPDEPADASVPADEVTAGRQV